MYNYSARPWVAIGIYVLLLSSLFYVRKPFAHGPVDIVPLSVISVLFAFFSFFAASYLVDYGMLFASKFVLHEVYQFRKSTSSSPVVVQTKTYPESIIKEEEDTFFSNDADLQSSFSSITVPPPDHSASSVSTSSSSSSTTSLRPRRDANQFMMF